jgi:23S rRNA (cytosine1962-C5)-methyltransferase
MKVILKPGKEKAILHRHHWIFSGAVASLPAFTDGDLLTVYSHSGEFLGSGYFNRKAKIVGRMVAFNETPPLQAIKQSLDAALALRKIFFKDSVTSAYRLINSEGDGLPGLTVDKYGELLVFQISTLGMEKLRDFIVDYFVKTLSPQAIFEKSQLPSRKEEGLESRVGFLHGAASSEVEIIENHLRFKVSVVEGQKTGFFLDHREMRQWVRELAQGRSILNCFSYTGGFSVAALAGGACRVDSVDISAKAIELAKENVQLNGFDMSQAGFFAEDVFEFLRSHPLNYDLVILDPPAFAKKQKDVIQACRGYKDINRIALQKMPARSLLLTSSCSYFVEEKLFQTVLFQAAAEAGRSVRIIGKHRLGFDHPINIFHPEGDYLKSFLLYIDS